MINILHYVYYANPISSGYTIRTHSIVKAQKKLNLNPSVAISVKSVFKNYFDNLEFPSKNVFDNIKYLSPSNELRNNSLFKHFSKYFHKKNRVSKHLREGFYNFQKGSIINDFHDFLKSEIGSVDIIHAHTPAIALNEAKQLNGLYNRKLIYEVRGFWNLSLENKTYEVINLVRDEIEACRKADKCIAICQGIADVLIEGGIDSRKIEIVPNAVELINPTIEVQDIELKNNLKLQDKLVYGYISTIRWFEGIQTIIKAWPKILEQIPNAVFILIGDGPYLGKLKSMIKELGIENSFLVLGKIPHNKILSYYSLIDIFVVPRINVPVSNIVTPLKPLEAMINSKPIIVSDVNALKEIVIDRKTGMYFRADDHNHLSEICIKLGKDDELRTRLGEDARVWVEENRTWGKIAEQYYEIYKSILN